MKWTVPTGACAPSPQCESRCSVLEVLCCGRLCVCTLSLCRGELSAQADSPEYERARTSCPSRCRPPRATYGGGSPISALTTNAGTLPWSCSPSTAPVRKRIDTELMCAWRQSHSQQLLVDGLFGLDLQRVHCGNETCLQPQLGTDLTSSACQFDMLAATVVFVCPVLRSSLPSPIERGEERIRPRVLCDACGGRLLPLERCKDNTRLASLPCFP